MFFLFFRIVSLPLSNILMSPPIPYTHINKGLYTTINSIPSTLPYAPGHRPAQNEEQGTQNTPKKEEEYWIDCFIVFYLHDICLLFVCLFSLLSSFYTYKPPGLGSFSLPTYSTAAGATSASFSVACSAMPFLGPLIM